VENHILIDVTHMSTDSLNVTLDLLDEKNVDPERNVPVVATHSAYRFGKLEYNLSDPHIRRIGQRKGVIGLIACDHYITDGLRGKTKTLDDSLEVLRRHIDKIASLTDGYDCIGIGSDLDGFIKPSLTGLEFPKGYEAMWAYLSRHYSDDIADKIFKRNAMRLLSYWRGA
jgi:microsomal dipeptidase-like Zn-dependent dipeptidase